MSSLRGQAAMTPTQIVTNVTPVMHFEWSKNTNYHFSVTWQHVVKVPKFVFYVTNE